MLAASLAPGQIINLFIAEDGANNDLDLLLANDELEVVGQSLGTGKFESLTVPEAAGTQRYFIQVDAFDGASNYVLTVSQPGANPASAAPQESAMSTQMAFVPHQALVQMKDPADAGFGARSLGATTRWLGQVPGGPGLLALSPEVTARAAVAGSGFNIVDPALAARIATLRAIKRVQRQAGVAWAEPNPLRKPHALPNDEFFSQQWHYGLINLPQAWDITTGSPEIRVAVADTGVRLAHPDLAGKFDPADPDGFDFVSDPALSLDGDGIDTATPTIPETAGSPASAAFMAPMWPARSVPPPTTAAWGWPAWAGTRASCRCGCWAPTAPAAASTSSMPCAMPPDCPTARAGARRAQRMCST